VYGELSEPPFFEDAPTGATNPYGQHQAHDRADPRRRVTAADSTTSSAVAVLRYFNPIGAHESGRIGEDPRGHPEQPAAVRRPGGGPGGARS
jgi:UDP-glucose 4-epimerase